MISTIMALRGLIANDQNKRAGRMLILGTILGLVASGWGWFVPWSRMVRGVVTTAMAESAFDPAAVGDNGASIGILQFNDVRADLLSRKDWRLSPFLSGYAVARYLRATDARIAVLRPGLDGLAAWRSAWVRGSALEPGDQRDVGAIALVTWEAVGGSYWYFTAVQVVAFGLALFFLPILAIPFLLISVVGWLR